MPTRPSPVTASLIIKDEPLLRDTLQKLRPHVAEIVVVDTGSKEPPTALAAEGLIDKLEVRPGEFDFYGIPIDFAKARNRSLGLASQPWVLWLDGDDVIEGLETLPALLADAETHRQGGEVEVFLPYEYRHDDGGRVEMLLGRERIHSNPAAWYWKYPIHEVMEPGPMTRKTRIERTNMVWKHRWMQAGKTYEGAAARNTAIVKKYFEVTPDDQVDYRMAFYGAMSLMHSGEHEDAIKWFQRSLYLTSCEEDKVMTSMQWSSLHIQRDELDKALAAACIAINSREDWPQGYFRIAKIWFAKAQKDPKNPRNWQRVIHFAKLGLELPPVSTIFFVDPRERYEINYYLIQAYNNLSRYDEAMRAAEEGLKGFPGDSKFEFNRQLFSSVILEKEIISRAEKLASMRGKEGSIDHFIEDTRKWFSHILPEIKAPPAPEPLREDGKLRIVIACGDGWEVWNPDVLVKGKGFGGGSEIAVIEMSKRLAARGHDVTVYTSCGEERDYDGVHWKQTARMYSEISTDVLIAWRRGDLLNHPIRGRVKVIWPHDRIIHFATAENFAKVDKVLALSRYHGEEILGAHASMGLTRDKIVPTRTGVGNMDLFTPQERTITRAIFNSSPDRGLKMLLEAWPTIRARVPEATLDIYYGFEMWRKMGHNQEQADALEAQIASMADAGVTMRGRVTAAELAQAMCASGAWLYPNFVFPEIACVAAMEAQIAGMCVVTTETGALPETVGDRGVLLGPSFFSTKFIERAVEALTTPADHPARERVSREARVAFGYDELVSDWEMRFVEWILEKEVIA
jgi:glycosyltransferase involved in cell wall biosynthesis